MKYHFSTHLLQRMPLFPVGYYNQPLDRAIHDPIFQAAIYLASPQFYARLNKAGFNLSQMDQREIIALNRYFNRACFRPTPFGYFASVSIGEWSPVKQPSAANSSSTPKAFIQPAEWLLQTVNRHNNEQDQPDTIYEPNTTLYRVRKYYRFIKEETGNGGKRTFQLQSSHYSLVLKDLLKYCRNGHSRDMIIKRICQDANCSPEEGEEYLEFLKDAQILLPKERPTITGLAVMNQENPRNPLPAALNVLSPLLQVVELQALENKLVAILSGHGNSEDKGLLNTIMIRPANNSLLDQGYQDKLRNGFFALDCLCQPDQLPALTRFKDGFLRHFEGERIPLLMALDPELGIGYQGEALEVPNPLLETVNIRPRNSNGGEPVWTAAHRYLMSAWLKTCSHQEGQIILDETGLSAIRKESGPLTTLGFSALFSISEQGTYIESAGGVNPAALIGRFTQADPAIYEAAKQMAAEIEQLNPELLFAELLHLADPHVDNVNRRASIWTYELPLLAGQSHSEATDWLRLDDLYVEVSGNFVLLWSKKHQKYIIPRLTSAYNHSIDALPLFRFMADLSYQYSRSQLSFDLADYFPGFSYYPRVCYQETILSSATWIIDTNSLPQKAIADDWINVFVLSAEQLRIPEQFILSEGDQQLVFNRKKREDLILLRETIQFKKQVTLREYLSPVNNGLPDLYQVQYNAFLLPEEPLNLPKPVIQANQQRQEQRKYIPGTEWLYLKLYVPRLSVNRLLLEIEPLLRKRFPNGKISRWFFIRYEDHAPHIRLRFKISPEDIDAVLTALRVILEENVHQHLIREYQLDVYSRELERYQAIGMEETEIFFWYSSSFVLQYLKAGKVGAAIPTYLAAALTTKLITEGFYQETTQQLNFWQETYEVYLTEFEGKQLKVELDQKYRETSRLLEQFLHSDIPFANPSVQQWVNKLTIKAAELGSKLDIQEAKKEYLLSLIHVHLNRIFTDLPRQQEMLIYFLLAKWMRSQVARQKVRVNGLS